MSKSQAVGRPHPSSHPPAPGQRYVYLPDLMGQVHIPRSSAEGVPSFYRRYPAIPHLPSLMCGCGMQLHATTQIGTWPTISCKAFSMGFKSVSIRDRPLYHVHLNREFRSDLQWWALLADKVEWEQLLIAILPGKPRRHHLLRHIKVVGIRCVCQSSLVSGPVATPPSA